MNQPDRTTMVLLRKIQMFPLFLLSLSRGKRLLIVILSYWVAIPGLWFLFPLVHNAASLVVPIICLCWFFRYRGLLISIFSIVLVMGLIYYVLLEASGVNLDLVVRAAVGLGFALLLGLMICWLRIAVDLMQVARQQTLVAEQERLLTLQAERHTRLAYEHQRQLNELKDQFLLHVNHELRTPLTVLGSSLELFAKYYEQMDAPTRTKLLTRSLANYEELVSLVNSVLDSVTVTGMFLPAHCESVPVRQTVQEVLAHLNSQDVRAYTIHLQVAEEMHVWADPKSLYHVLQNLLSNIFKYVPTQTIISIEAAQPTPSAPVCLSVQDAGPGIPPEELPLLFEKFVRLKRDVGGPKRGTGLGLSICKCLIEAMDGHIWVESSGRMGEGSRFCITLPPNPQHSLLSLD